MIRSYAAKEGFLDTVLDLANANFQQLGIQLPGFHDFGISMQEKRVGAKMNGE